MIAKICDMTIDEYNKLLSTGMFYALYPNATGMYEKDVELSKCDAFVIERQLTATDNTIIDESLQEITQQSASISNDMTLQFLKKLDNGGRITSSSLCSAHEIVCARANDNMLVTDDMLGYVYQAYDDLDISSIAEIIRELNIEIAVQTECEYFIVDLSTDGAVINIKFNGLLIWSSEMDDRKYDEQSDTYESLETFLRRQIMNELNIMRNIKL